MGISWGYHGDIMEISWGYHGDIMEISWRYHGDIMGISWGIMELVVFFFEKNVSFIFIGGELGQGMSWDGL